MATNTDLYGGSGGVPFDDGTTEQLISALTVWHGDVIDAVQFGYGSGTGPKHGGSGGACATAVVQPGECVVGVFGSYQNVVTQLGFVIAGFNSVRLFGPFGKPSTLQFAGYGRLRSISGRSGGYVDAIAFALDTSATPAPALQPPDWARQYTGIDLTGDTPPGPPPTPNFNHFDKPADPLNKS